MSRHTARLLLPLLLAGLGCFQNTDDAPEGSDLRLNHIQVKGTHNSYHVAPDPYLNKFWDFTMPPLATQLGDLGVRQFELDVHWHPDDGRYAVYHTPPMFLDDGTTCYWFTDCLAEMKAWSDAHPHHHTLFVYIEPKDDMARVEPKPDIEEELIAGHLDALDAEILSVWPRERLVTPDDVQRGYDSVAAGLAAEGWPRIDATRGKMLLMFMDSSELRDEYTSGGTSLAGRLLFPEGNLELPYVVLRKLDDPIEDAAEIETAIAAGFLIRTRADSTDEPLKADFTRQEAALASGAQMVSTDYPAPVEGVDYWLEIEDGTPSRCNPLTAPPECTAELIEDPERSSR